MHIFVALRARLSRANAASANLHGRIYALRKLPWPVVRIILVLAVVNALVWAACGVVLHYHSALLSTAILSYTFGLRHALDADHISAIDLVTRRLIVTGQRPVTVGTFFSLGHSTVVFITAVAVAATSSAVSKHFNRWSQVGSIIGVSFSAGFLIILALANLYLLWNLLKRLHSSLQRKESGLNEDEEVKIIGAGCLYLVFRKLFNFIDRPWKMYPLGFLFGLGFDTSSEIALLGIASVQAVRGTSIWLIMIFPILFTAGMCLLDTIDGALMMSLYTSTALARDQVAILYYSIVLTLVTVVVALTIGIIQVLTLILNTTAPSGRFWDGLKNAGDHYDIIGGAICATFVLLGGSSIPVYRPWRRWIDNRYRLRQQRADEAAVMSTCLGQRATSNPLT